MEFSIANIALMLLAGLTSVASPCVLPVIPIIVTGTNKDHKLRPLLIVLGLSISFILMGILTSAFGSVIEGRILYIEKAVGIVIVFFGILMLFDINIFKKITISSKFQIRTEGTFSGFFLGLALGIIWIPCIGPVLSGVLALVATQGKMAGGALMLAIYSIGFSIPILIAGYGAHFFRNKITLVQKHPLLIRILSGGLLIAFGVYIFKQGLLSFGW